MFDRDTNSVVIFKYASDPSAAEPYIEINDEMRTYESLWVYFHPMNHQGEHRRLRSFDVQCFDDGEWKTVLDQSNKAQNLSRLKRLHPP